MAIKRGFSTVEEHDEYVIKQFNSVVNKKDLTFILGDITMEKHTHYYQLDRLNGRKVAVMGNHDERRHVHKLLEYVDQVAGCVQYKLGSFLTHVPVHPMEFSYRMRYNIHGHLHEKKVKRKLFGFIPIKDKRYVCVSCESVNYKPKSLVELGIIDKR
jgi:calcineurin-like phosphoesterase family protein